MARQGRSGYKHYIDVGNTNVPANGTELVNLQAPPLIGETSVEEEDAGFGTNVNKMTPIGVVQGDEITLEGFVEYQADGTIDPNSAYARIGAAERSSDYTPRTFRQQHGTNMGVYEQVEVWVKTRRIVPSTTGNTRFTATLVVVSRVVSSGLG